MFYVFIKLKNICIFVIIGVVLLFIDVYDELNEKEFVGWCLGWCC